MILNATKPWFGATHAKLLVASAYVGVGGRARLYTFGYSKYEIAWTRWRIQRADDGLIENNGDINTSQ